jgi:signal transduction histidine kinase/CheY-like chemotaxis protein
VNAPNLTPPAAPSLELQREQQAWRERTLSGIALALFTCCVSVAAWYALVKNPSPEMLPVLLGAALLLGGTAFSRRLPFGLRVWVTLAALYAPCIYAVRLVGFNPNPFVGFGTICVVGTLLLGRRVGLALVFGTGLTILAIGFAHHGNLLERVPGWQANVDSASTPIVIRVVGIFLLLTTTLVIAVSYLLQRSEELLLEKARSLETLRREQLERERITRDLELREAAFHKARELELLGRLAGSMAHDFNNALLVMWASLDDLGQLPALPDAARAPLLALRAAADQASATTRQLRAFGPMAPRRAVELPLGPVLARAKAMFARVLPQNIKLAADVRVDAWLLADEGEVLRVLMNLALNARDAMRDGGELTLRVRPPSSRELDAWRPDQPSAPGVPSVTGIVVLEVEDTGSGMSEEVRARLFEPFFTTKQASGTGLGLASVRDIVTAHGGRVDVTSEVGTGTTISLTWPTVSEPAQRALATPFRASNERVVVLLVDDDPAVRLALSRGLTRAGMTVLEAADGAAALTTARRHAEPIHVLCTDCVMQGPPVRQLIAQFRALHHGRVLVCSGYAPADTGLTEDIFDDFLTKPFTSEDLAQRIRSVLETARGA